MRICLVTPFDLAEEGGVKKHAFHLAERLRLGGDHVDVAGPWSLHSPPPDGVRGFSGVVNIPANGSQNHLALFVSPLAVRRFVAGYDVVHVHSPEVPPLGWYCAWFAGRAARVATFHAYNENEGGLSRLARRAVCGPQLRLYDRGIAVSQAAARFAAPAWSRPLTLIPNGVDTQVFSPGPRGDGPLRILFVGHWRDPRKGLPVLLDAWSQLDDVELHVVGAGPEAERRPGVRYHGAIRDEAELARHYRRCDLFVAPSLGQESFGIVLLEAMACGKAIVCSDLDGYREVVTPEGARLVPPGDVGALTAAMKELLETTTRRQQMGEANRRAALGYDWSALAGRVREVYVEALSRSPSTATTPPARARSLRP